MDNLNSGLDVILFTRGTKGDLYPFLRLGAELKARGCRITLLSNYCYESYAKKEGFEFVALDDEVSFNALNNNPEAHGSLAAKLKLSKDHIVANLEQEVNVIINHSSHRNVVMIAHSNDYLAPLLVREKLSLPLYLCVLAPSYIHSFSLFEALLYGLADELNKIRNQLSLKPISDWKKWLHNFDQGFAFWPVWFSNEENNMLPRLRHLGFLSIDSVEDAKLQVEIKAFIEGDARKILITHGTSMPFDNLYFKLALDASQKIDCKLIVSTPFRDLLPDFLPENVMWVKFCPFHELLPYIDLIIHHGGIGTTQESIAHSVPQLIIGQGFDRQHNGRLVRDLGLGDWIIPKAFSEEVLLKKVSELLEKEIVKSKCDQIKFFLYDRNALESFCEIVMQRDKKSLVGINAIKNVANFNGCLEGYASSTDVQLNNLENTSLMKNNEFEVDSIANMLTVSKQKLLLKMLKEKK